MKQLKSNNVLVIGDTHFPFHHDDYLDFCIETKKKYKCTEIVHIGDVCDLHSCSYHEHSPDGYSPADEMAKCDIELKKWFKAFPKVKVCKGNHDLLVNRKSKTIGLPDRCFRSFSDMWGYPDGWEDGFEWVINGVLYMHGTGFGGKQPHLNAAIANRMSTVIGHCHSIAGVAYTASNKDIIFGMSVGCGLDRKSWAFDYGKNIPKKPILSVGVVFNDKNAQVIPMKMK